MPPSFPPPSPCTGLLFPSEMKTTRTHAVSNGFTVRELLACVAVLGLLVFLFAPAFSKAKASSGRWHCKDKLRQISWALRAWSHDHADSFPWEVNAGGSSGGTKEHAATGNVWKHFQATSNELYTPKTLRCEKDSERTAAKWWDEYSGNSQVSYFVGLDADEKVPESILTGDRNLATSAKLLTGVAEVNRQSRLEWTTSIHNRSGNVAFVDGSVSEMSADQLNLQLQSTTQSVLRFAFPQ